MPNAIKYSLSAQTLALKKGNFFIGTGDVGKGPTSTTDYYNGITPGASGYTIYLNKASQGPSIYTAANDAALISLSNTIAGQTFATAAAALAWFATQTDKMVFNIDYPAIVTNGLILTVDAGFTPSYPTTGTTWYDVSSSGSNGTLTNGPTYNSANGGSIVFDGTNDYCGLSPNIFSGSFTGVTFGAWVYLNGSISQALIAGVWDNTIEGDVAALFIFSNGPFVAVGDGNRSENGAGVGNTLNINQWYYIAASWNSNRTYKLYRNGSLLGTSTQTGNGWNSSSTVSFDIGAQSENNFRYFNGRIASTQVYNRTLSDSEVLQNYNAQKTRFGL
jgi:hypothetical protein